MLTEKEIDSAILTLQKVKEFIAPTKKRRVTKSEKIRSAELEARQYLFKKR